MNIAVSQRLKRISFLSYGYPLHKRIDILIVDETLLNSKHFPQIVKPKWSDE